MPVASTGTVSISPRQKGRIAGPKASKGWGWGWGSTKQLRRLNRWFGEAGRMPVVFVPATQTVFCKKPEPVFAIQWVI